MNKINEDYAIFIFDSLSQSEICILSMTCRSIEIKAKKYIKDNMSIETKNTYKIYKFRNKIGYCHIGKIAVINDIIYCEFYDNGNRKSISRETNLNCYYNVYAIRILYRKLYAYSVISNELAPAITIGSENDKLYEIVINKYKIKSFI